MAISSFSHPALIFEVNRISDTQARITGFGTLDENVGSFGIELINIFGASNFPVSFSDSHSFSGTLTIGESSIASVSHLGRSDLRLGFDGNELNEGDVLNANLLVTLSSRMWAGIGTSDLVREGTPDIILPIDAEFDPIGVYSVISTTAVPIPTSIWLFGSAFISLLGLRKLNKEV